MDKDFVDVVRLMILRWGDYAGLFGCAKYKHKGLHKEGGRNRMRGHDIAKV